MSILTSKRYNFLSKGLCILITWLFLAMPMILVRASDEIVYYHNDALGSPVAATDEQGNLLWREDYKPYGERILKQDNGKNSLWYTGKPEEKDFGINYFGARWYDPSIGRFIATDPAPFQEKNIHSFNRYAYANNNPYKFVDPDGYKPEDFILLNWPRLITWKEFKGPVDKKSEFSASSNTGFTYEISSTKIGEKGEEHFETKSSTVTVTHNKRLSWVKRDEISDDLLSHEQGHYDISGIIARDFLNAVRKLNEKTAKAFDRKVKELFRSSMKDLRRLQEQYDDDTHHGLNHEIQRERKQEIDKWTRIHLGL